MAVALAFAQYTVYHPAGWQIGAVELSERTARGLGMVGSVVLAVGIMRRLGSLLPGAPAVVITPEQIINYAGDGWFPPHPRARWDEVVAVRVATRLLQRELVLELRDRRPMRVGLAWLSEGDVLELRSQVASRTGRSA